jgi:5-methylcytosine-specific restriction endonuclease McrA
MAIELETFLEIFFNNIRDIEDKKTDNKRLYCYEIGAQKDLIMDIIRIIHCELSNFDKNTFGNLFCNYSYYINQTEMSDFLLQNIKNINCINEQSKEIIINYLEIVLLDKFERNDNIKRTLLYYKKIFNEILIRWNKNFNDYFDDITEFNKLLQTYNITQSFNIFCDLSSFNAILRNIDDNTKIIFLDFFEKLIIKYNKQDKIKEKLQKIKKTNSPKLDTVSEPEITTITDVEIKTKTKPKSTSKSKEKSPITKLNTETKTKKKKKPISSTMKRLVWNTNIGEEKGKSKCLCCKSTEISQMSFHCGHIIAESNGGETIVSNLKPICQNCNSSMGAINMNEFMKSLK